MTARMTLFDLAVVSKVPERTLRHYEQRGLLPRPTKEDGFLYGERHVRVVAAIMWFRKEGIRSLDVLQSKLDALSEDELAEFGFRGIDEPEEPYDEDTDDEEEVDEEAEEPAAPPIAGAQTSASPPATGLASDVRAREVLVRRVVRPGLELLVRQDGELERIADEICARYGLASDVGPTTS